MYGREKRVLLREAFAGGIDEGSPGRQAENKPLAYPVFEAIDVSDAHCDSYSSRCSNTIPTARSRTSEEYRVDLPIMTPILSRNRASGKPGADHRARYNVRMSISTKVRGTS